MKKTRKIIAILVLSIVLLGVFAEVSEAARWCYHAWRPGRVTVWGTRNCRIDTWPLVYRRPVVRCQVIRGFVPWWCNDWMVRLEWGPPCGNITWYKHVPRPCPRSCWWYRWVMGPLDDYLVDYVPSYYGRSQFVLPSLGDPNGNLTGNQGIYIFVDLGQWLDAGSPYTPLPPDSNSDPNTIHYYFSNGHCSSLPGYTVMRIDPNMSAEDVQNLVTFDPNADPNGYPFVFNDPNLFFTGTLYLSSEGNFTSEAYNGNLVGADADWSGHVDFNDFHTIANQWLADVNTAKMPPSAPSDP